MNASYSHSPDMPDNTPQPDPTGTTPPPTDASHTAVPEGAAVPKSARTWAMLSHLGGLVGFIMVVPFANLIAPLAIWLIKKDEHPFIDEQGKEALNFQITIIIAMAVSLALTFVLIGFVLVPVVYLAAVILMIIATIKSNEGEHYRYPLTLRLV